MSYLGSEFKSFLASDISKRRKQVFVIGSEDGGYLESLTRNIKSCDAINFTGSLHGCLLPQAESGSNKGSV